jgi:hypothetical protein
MTVSTGPHQGCDMRGFVSELLLLQAGLPSHSTLPWLPLAYLSSFQSPAPWSQPRILPVSLEMLLSFLSWCTFLYDFPQPPPSVQTRHCLTGPSWLFPAIGGTFSSRLSEPTCSNNRIPLPSPVLISSVPSHETPATLFTTKPPQLSLAFT